MKRCCFSGHGQIADSSALKIELKRRIIELIEKKEVKEFWVGNYGDFDKMVVNVLIELKKEYQYVGVYLVIPYITKRLNDFAKEYNNKFDAILVAEISGSVPMKYRIVKANEYMVDNSDYMICYVKYSWGGAARTFEYAKRKKKSMNIINLAE